MATIRGLLPTVHLTEFHPFTSALEFGDIYHLDADARESGRGGFAAPTSSGTGPLLLVFGYAYPAHFLGRSGWVFDCWCCLAFELR